MREPYGFYDRDGEPLPDVLAWGRLRESLDYFRIGLDRVGDVEVSTVWIGVDHGHDPSGPPIIFETMVFGLDTQNFDGSGGERRIGGETHRYATAAEARAGHDRIVAELRLVSNWSDGISTVDAGSVSPADAPEA